MVRLGHRVWRRSCGQTTPPSLVEKNWSTAASSRRTDDAAAQLRLIAGQAQQVQLVIAGGQRQVGGGSGPGETLAQQVVQLRVLFGVRREAVEQLDHVGGIGAAQQVIAQGPVGVHTPPPG